MEIRTQFNETNEIKTIFVSGPIDQVSIGKFESELNNENSPATVKVDLKDVDFINSTFIKAILIFVRDNKNKNKRLILSNPCTLIEEILKITQVSDLCEISHDESTEDKSEE